MGKRVSQPLGAAAAHVAPRLVADDGEQRILLLHDARWRRRALWMVAGLGVAAGREQRLRHAAHVWVAAVAVRRREPEAGVVRQVAVPLHREHAPRRPRACGRAARVGQPRGVRAALGGGWSVPTSEIQVGSWRCGAALLRAVIGPSGARLMRTTAS